MTVTMVADRPTSCKPQMQPLDAKVEALAQYLKQRAARDPRWGAAFIRALDRGLAYHQQGLHVERYNAAFWVAPSASRPFARHICNKWACDCEAFAKGEGQWCWHRAMIMLHTVEAEFDQVHGLCEDKHEADRTLDAPSSYRIVIELAG